MCRLLLQQVKQLFPRDGSKATPPHPSADFKWKDYCPMAFRQLREVFNIDPGDYMLSICGILYCHHYPHAVQMLFFCLLAVMLSLHLGLMLPVTEVSNEIQKASLWKGS